MAADGAAIRAPAGSVTADERRLIVDRELRVIYVNDPAKLESAVRAIAAAPCLAVDTEADSLHRYAEKLCLMQVSTTKDDFVLDPLAPLDLGPAARALEHKDLIFHGADYDLRMIDRTYGFKPSRVFDTMIAAQLLGYSAFSFAALAERHCGVVLPKANQKADWSFRPLKESMLTYAASDSHYLHRIAPALEKELRGLGRFGWFEESCRAVIETVALDERPALSSRWRIKGSGALKPRELCLLKEIWEWRDDLARKKDRPSFKVLNNDVLIDIVKWKVDNPDKPVREMPKVGSRYNPQWLEGIDVRLKAGFNTEPHTVMEKLAPKGGVRRLTNGEKNTLDELKAARKELAAELSVEAGILAPASALEAIVVARPRSEKELADSKLLKRWQAGVVGARFVDILTNPNPKAPRENGNER